VTKEQRDNINAKFTELAASVIDLRNAMRDILDNDEDVPISEEIQHVGYDEEQCGRTK